jgi:hypothetical protein
MYRPLSIFCFLLIPAVVFLGCGDDPANPADTASPTVVDWSPPNGATDVDVSSVLIATFSEVIAPSSATTGSFTLTSVNDRTASSRAATSRIEGAVSGSGRVLTFTPASDLTEDTTYTATLTTAIADLAGNSLSGPFTWSFRTLKSPAPTVVSTSPTTNATGVGSRVNIAATFSEPISPATATTSTFLLTGPQGAVLGVVSTQGTTIEFDPAGSLAGSTTYVATLTTGITGLAGNPLESQFSWSFSTSGYPYSTTENQLVQNFLDAYTERNFAEYDRILHEDFEFHFADEDVDPGRGVPPFWDRQADVLSTQTMFSGQPGRLNEDGVQQSPVQSINLTLSPRNIWSSDGIPAEFAAEKWREYDAVMLVGYANGDIAQVTGYQRFYIKHVTLEGGNRVWRLRVWRDTGPRPGKQFANLLSTTSDTSFGSVKFGF